MLKYKKRGVPSKKQGGYILMKKTLSLVLVLMIAAGCMGIMGTACADAYDDAWYVKTGNGKSLNVRDVNTGKVVGSFRYGEALWIYYQEGEWSIVGNDRYDHVKVMTKFLSKKNPGAYKASSSTSTKTTTDSALSSETVEGMNKQYSTIKYGERYSVLIVPPTRIGTVNLRWGPSMNSSLVAKVPADYELQVLAENKNWLMCEDPASGRIVYVVRKYTTAK